MEESYMEDYQNKNEWLASSRGAVIQGDASEAYKAGRAWLDFMGQPIEVPQADQYMEALRQNLLLTAFPLLSEKIADIVLESLTRSFFADNQYQLPAKQKIENRFLFVGYGFYEEERERLTAALKRSTETIGGESIKYWITKFEQFQTAREERVVEEFLLQATDNSRMNKDETLVLESVLRVYQEYLRYPVFNIYDYAVTQRGETVSRGTPVTVSGESGFETMPLLKALSKFSNIGNQIITEERLKLKNQVEPARASVSNWLRVYREELGIGRHDAVDRAKFLFESPNTRKLNQEERERIHALVRSLEDEEALNIDSKKQEIVFSYQAKPEKFTPLAKASFDPNTPSPDIFERFQNIAPPPSTELKNVGTQTFSGGKMNTEKNNGEEGAVLSRIKKMRVSQPLASGPAPREDFLSTHQVTSLLPQEQQPMGTLRFSAKHVLPAERKISKISSGEEKKIMDPRLEHFRPQAVPIPGDMRKNYPSPVTAPSTSYQNSPPSFSPSPSAPAPAIPSPVRVSPEEPESMFRIKPTRE